MLKFMGWEDLHMAKKVKIQYTAEPPHTEITADGMQMDTSRIEGRRLEEWAYPFFIQKVQWNGISEELKAFTGTDDVHIQFQGTEAEMRILRDAVKNTPMKVAGTDNRVVIFYRRDNLTTRITVNGKIFDTSRIQNRSIEEWIGPFQFRDLRWDGIFQELENVLGTDEYTIQFAGEQEDMRELMQHCPDTVSLTFKAAETAKHMPKAGNLKMPNVTENENLKAAAGAAADAAVNAAKKLDSSVSNAVSNIQNAEGYQKLMANEKVQKVKNNSVIQKIAGFWKGLNKIVKYAVVIGLVVVILVIVLVSCFGKDKSIIAKSDGQLGAIQCPHSCEGGKFGFYDMSELSDKVKGSGYLYFRANDYTTTYLLEGEDGTQCETIAGAGSAEGEASGFDSDAKVQSDDVDGDGYVTFAIKKFDGEDYVEVCTIKGEVKE